MIPQACLYTLLAKRLMQSIVKMQQGESLNSQVPVLEAFNHFPQYVIFGNFRKKISGNGRRGTEVRKPTRKPPAFAKLPPPNCVQDARRPSQTFQKRYGHSVHNSIDSEASLFGKLQNPSSEHEKEEASSHVKHASQGDVPFSGPLQVSVSSGFAWAKRRKDGSHNRSLSRGYIPNLLGPSPAFSESTDVESKINENEKEEKDSQDREAYEMLKLSMLKRWRQLERPDSFDASDEYHSQELSLALYQREEKSAKLNHLVC